MILSHPETGTYNVYVLGQTIDLLTCLLATTR